MNTTLMCELPWPCTVYTYSICMYVCIHIQYVLALSCENKDLLLQHWGGLLRALKVLTLQENDEADEAHSWNWLIRGCALIVFFFFFWSLLEMTVAVPELLCVKQTCLSIVRRKNMKRRFLSYSLELLLFFSHCLFLQPFTGSYGISLTHTQQWNNPHICNLKSNAILHNLVSDLQKPLSHCLTLWDRKPWVHQMTPNNCI